MYIERYTAIGCLLLSLIFLFVSSDLTFWGEKGVDAGFFPIITSILLSILSIIYLIKNLHKKQSTQISKRSVFQQIILFISLCIGLYLSKIIGMLLTLGIFLFLTLTYMQKIPLKKTVPFSLITIAIMFLLFEVWLGISLPKGIF